MRRFHLRSLTEEERKQLNKLSRSRSEPSQRVERAKMILMAAEGETITAIAAHFGRAPKTISRRLQRFNEAGMDCLDDLPRSGRPPEYSEEERGQMIATARTHPQTLDLPYGHWSLRRLVKYINEELEIGISRAQLARVLEEEGLRWYQEKTYFTERPDPQFAEKRAPSSSFT
jgi:transposase